MDRESHWSELLLCWTWRKRGDYRTPPWQSDMHSKGAKGPTLPDDKYIINWQDGRRGRMPSGSARGNGGMRDVVRIPLAEMLGGSGLLLIYADSH